MIPDPVTIDPSKPVEFTEAVDYFRRQAPWISGSSWATMARLAALKGDQVSGVSMLGMVDDVWKRMDKSLAEGTPYSEFVREIGKDFKRDWADGVDSPRMKLIYNNNIGSALMAGRMTQITDPDVISDRPYFLLDVIEDAHTSDVCAPLNGIIRPADDPFWSTHTPLLHPNCRTTIISLDEEDARAEGGVTSAAKLKKLPGPESGWGSPHSWEDWKPKGEDYAPALFAQYAAWRDSKEYARDRSAWLSSLSKSWADGLGLDQQDLEKVIQLPPDTPREVVRRTTTKVRPSEEESRDDVRYYLDQWVLGSKRKASVTLKKAAVKELNLPGVAYSRVEWDIDERDVTSARPTVRRIYEDTQDALRATGITTIRLYRGVKAGYSEVGVMESWTTDPKVAKKFDGADVLVRDVPVEHIFAFSGGPGWVNGKYGEQHEYIILSSAYSDK